MFRNRAPMLLLLCLGLLLPAIPSADDNPDSALLTAILAGDAAAVGSALARGANVDATDSNGRSGLRLAVRSGDKEIVKTLLEAGAGIDPPSPHAQHPAVTAVRNGRAEILDLLLQRGTDPNDVAQTTTLLGEAAAHRQSEEKALALCKVLLAHGADPNLAVKPKPPLIGQLSAERPLHRAARHGYAKVAELLLDKGADADGAYRAEDRRRWSDRTPLWIAVHQNQLPLARLLLERGADPFLSYAGLIGAPAVQARIDGHADMIALFDAAGADLSGVDPDAAHQALTQGVQRGSRHLAAVLDAHVPIDATNPVTGESALHLAATQGRLEAARLLIERGIDIDFKPPNGGTPLHNAARYDRVALVRLLIAHGAKIDARTDPGGRTPLHFAAEQGHGEATRMLLRAGADANARDSNGDMPVHAALRAHKNEQATFAAVSALVSHGADINAPGGGRCAETPLLLAVKGFSTRLEALLREHGADPEATDKCQQRIQLQ